VADTEIDPLTGQAKVLNVWTPALRAEALGGHDIIRLLEFFPYVLVSERFVRVFTESGFTGASYNPVPIR
jgi:hypothetical protein